MSIYTHRVFFSDYLDYLECNVYYTPRMDRGMVYGLWAVVELQQFYGGNNAEVKGKAFDLFSQAHPTTVCLLMANNRRHHVPPLPSTDL